MERPQLSRPGSSHSGSSRDVDRSGARPQLQVASLDRKRKAEDILPTSSTKIIREDKESAPKPKLLSTNSQQSTTLKRPTLSTSTSSLSVPYRGTSKAAPNSASPTTPGIDTNKAPPKKGSYAEIMARAKTSQAAAAAVGVIKHKPKPKEALSNKKEILLRKKGLSSEKRARLKGALGRSMLNSNGSSLGSGSLGAPKSTDAKNNTKDSSGGYKGTATAKPQPSYKGTMKSVGSINSLGRKNSDARGNGKHVDRGVLNNRYPASRETHKGGYASGEEDEDEEDNEDIMSDASTDDMEAGFSDVEDEEIHASHFAKKEDDEQARIEAQMKKEKEDRKRRLNLMAKNAKKRPF